MPDQKPATGTTAGTATPPPAPGIPAGTAPTDAVNKGKRGGSRVPAGHKKISFYVKDEHHDALAQAAEADDRDVDGYASMMVKKHAKGLITPTGQQTTH